LIANPAAVSCINVFDDMIRLLRRAGHRSRNGRASSTPSRPRPEPTPRGLPSSIAVSKTRSDGTSSRTRRNGTRRFAAILSSMPSARAAHRTS
jgi:hypothetical protein